MSDTQHDFHCNNALSAKLARTVAGDLRDAIAARGKARLAVSGGSTPATFFSALSREQLDWRRVAITQVDERWVHEDDADSNARLIRENLLRNEAARARFISMKTGAASPFEAEQAASEKLSEFAAGIDVVVLGMGEDGHTASFFPGAETLARALDPQGESLCVAVRPLHAPHERMTLSLPVVLGAGRRYLQIVGPRKLEVLRQAQAGGEVAEMPIRAVLGSELDIYYANRN